jgi:hypothetical protein
LTTFNHGKHYNITYYYPLNYFPLGFKQITFTYIPCPVAPIIIIKNGLKEVDKFVSNFELNILILLIFFPNYNLDIIKKSRELSSIGRKLHMQWIRF